MVIDQFTGCKLGAGKLCLVIGVITTVLLSGCSAFDLNTLLNNTTTQNEIDNGEVNTLSSAPDQTPTPIPTHPPTPTVIPIPTLIFDDNAEALAYLFTTNFECEFPCWWGIVPGETEWLAAEAFLKRFTVESEQQAYLDYLDDGATEHRLVLQVPETIDPDGLGSITIVEDWWGFVSKISISTNFTEMGYDIQSFLEEFGAPGEVYIYTSGGDENFLGGGSIYTVGLFYPDKGILMGYFGIFVGPAGASSEIEICKSGFVDEFAWLELWDTTKERTFENVATPGLNSGGELVFERIGNISSLSADDFYNQMIDDIVPDFCFEVVSQGGQE